MGNRASAPQRALSLSTSTEALPYSHVEERLQDLLTGAVVSLQIQLESEGLEDRYFPQWVHDDEIPSCMVCGQSRFHGMLGSWRHHCRNCGRLVCAACSPSTMSIPHVDGRKAPHKFEPEAEVRICTLCEKDPVLEIAHSVGVARASLAPVHGGGSDEENYYRAMSELAIEFNELPESAREKFFARFEVELAARLADAQEPEGEAARVTGILRERGFGEGMKEVDRSPSLTQLGRSVVRAVTAYMAFTSALNTSPFFLTMLGNVVWIASLASRLIGWSGATSLALLGEWLPILILFGSFLYAAGCGLHALYTIMTKLPSGVLQPIWGRLESSLAEIRYEPTPGVQAAADCILQLESVMQTRAALLGSRGSEQEEFWRRVFALAVQSCELLDEDEEFRRQLLLDSGVELSREVTSAMGMLDPSQSLLFDVERNLERAPDKPSVLAQLFGPLEEPE